MRHYIHHVPGRIRVRTPHLKNRPLRADEISRGLRERQGVRSVRMNVVTGSVTVTFAPSVISGEAILDQLSRSGVVDPSRSVSNDEVVGEAASRAGALVAKAAAGVVIDRLLAGTSLGVLAALV